MICINRRCPNFKIFVNNLNCEIYDETTHKDCKDFVNNLNYWRHDQVLTNAELTSFVYILMDENKLIKEQLAKIKLSE